MEITIKRISEEMKLQNKKQTELAAFIGVTPNVITDWKSGRIKSYSKYIHGVAEFLNVSVEYLKGETDQKYVHTKMHTGSSRLQQDIKMPYEYSTEPFIATNREMKVIMEYRTNPEMQQQVNEFLNKEKVYTYSDADAKVALFGGDSEVTDEMWDEVKSFVDYIKNKYKKD